MENVRDMIRHEFYKHVVMDIMKGMGHLREELRGELSVGGFFREGWKDLRWKGKDGE